MNSTRYDAACLAILLLAAGTLTATAPHAGDFWWSDAPRHALNGIFLKDFLLDLPLENPRQYAIDYYLRYPALTILLYPPLFYVLSVPVYLVLGDNALAAQIAVGLHYAGLGAGAYMLARLWLPRLQSLAMALLLMSLPVVALWGRQVMLEIPALAFVTWSTYFFVRFSREDRTLQLFLALAFLLGALYTKLSAVFLFPVIGAYFLVARGLNLLRDRRVWLAVIVALLGLAPLIVLTMSFGRANVQSVMGIADAVARRSTLSGWIWYAKHLPSMLGWTTLLLALAFLIDRARRRNGRIGREEFLFFVLWIVAGYLFFSFIDLKEERHAVFLVIPIALWAILAIDRLVPHKLAAGTSLIFAVGTFVFVLATEPIPFVAGYREAARIIAAEAPEGSVIVFSGKRDGSFTFNVRTATGRSDLSVIRADKLLLDIAVRRELGVGTRDYSEDQIRSLLNEVGAQYVVAQRDFWLDLVPMARLQRVLESDVFEEIGRIQVASNIPLEDRELRLYRARAPVTSGPRRLKLHLPIIGRELEGEVGGQ